MDEMLQAFAEQVVEEYPVLKQVIDQAKAGDLSEQDALRCMNEIMMADPGLAKRFQDAAREALKGLERATPLDHGGLIVHKARGLPRLNPQVEAALIERAQYDDDIPELRTGSMPRGVMPAVPVQTDVRNPAALGKMLTEASQQIADKVAVQEPERQKLITQVAQGSTDAWALIEQSGHALTKGQAEDLLFDGKNPAVDIPEYRRGHIPTQVAVAQPSGSALLAMTPAEQRMGAWKFLSTTQGRRTALASLTELAEVKLRGEGFEVQVRPFEPGAREPVLAAHEWSIQIDGPGATQAAFSLIDVAAIAIAKGLASKVQRRGRVILEVTTVNTVDIRSVGWAGRLLSADNLLG